MRTGPDPAGGCDPKRAPSAERAVFKTGPLSVWLYHVLIAEELPAICIDTRRAKAALDLAANNTNANDADSWPSRPKSTSIEKCR